MGTGISSYKMKTRADKKNRTTLMKRHFAFLNRSLAGPIHYTNIEVHTTFLLNGQSECFRFPSRHPMLQTFHSAITMNKQPLTAHTQMSTAMWL